MFTGIIKELGTITEIITDGSSIHLWVTSPLTQTIAIDNSIAHNGICLTVVEIKGAILS